MMSLQENLPVIAMIITQCTFAAMNLLSKAAISSGTKPCIFVVYRQGLATICLTAVAYIAHRKKNRYPRAPPLHLPTMIKIFIASALGLTMMLNLNYEAYNYVSATFVTSMDNTVPVMVFIMALLTRSESLSLTKKHSWAKITGSTLSLAGAMLFTFYHGPTLIAGSTHSGNLIAKAYTKADWVKGAFISLVANLAWSFWLIMQGHVIKEYPAKLWLMAIQSGTSFVITAVYAAAVERKLALWKLGWNIYLLSVLFSGIFVSGFAFLIQIWVVERKGALFSAVFDPLAMVVTAVFSAAVFHESVYLGGVLGGVLLILGLYCFLWGETREARALEVARVPAEGEIQM